jgi:hypothetical protein
MVKATKNVFATLGRFKDVSIPFVDSNGNNEVLEIRLNNLKLGDVVDIDGMNEGQELELIRASLIKSIPDITEDDIKELPLDITKPLVDAICEFNDIDPGEVSDVDQ